MDYNPHDYDGRISWIPQQHQQDDFFTAQDKRQQAPQAPKPQQKKYKKMPKERTLALAARLKKWLAIASVLGFGTFGGLVTLHQVGSTTAQTSSGSSQTNKSTLKQQGGKYFATATPTTASKVSTPTPAPVKTRTPAPTATPTAVSQSGPPVSGTHAS